VIDSAHNPEGLAVASATLDDDFHHEGETILVVGMLAPRDPKALLAAFDSESVTTVIASAASTPRAIPPEQIAAAATDLGLNALVEPDVGRAVDRARRMAGPSDVIFITGSFWFVGPARTHLLSGR
jgi:dihydrofolate synthase/folylpolyglutamate synthase